MSIDFDEEFTLVKALREAQALEVKEERSDGSYVTSVVPCELSNLAADRIVELEEQVSQLRQQLTNWMNKKDVD